MPQSPRDPNALTKYIYTFSGRKVELEGDGAPSVLDIAVHLGRIPRFVGATATFWTVLHHSLCAERVARRWCEEKDILGAEYIRLAALLHDAHESLVGDIPAPYKSKEMRDVQEEFDRRIWESIEIANPKEITAVRAIVQGIDKALLGVEGERLGPPTAQDDWWSQCNNQFSSIADFTVRKIRARYRYIQDTVHASGRAVQDFIEISEDLIKKVKGE